MSRAALIALDPALVPYAEAGMPEGALALATERAMEAAALASSLLDKEVVVDALSVALLLHLPEVMAASYGSAWWPAPPPPRPAPGGGWFNAELGSPENAESFKRLMASLPGDVDAASLAEAAQEWRLPVCDYRALAASPPWRDDAWASDTPAVATPAVAGGASGTPTLSGWRVR